MKEPNGILALFIGPCLQGRYTATDRAPLLLTKYVPKKGQGQAALIDFEPVEKILALLRVSRLAVLALCSGVSIFLKTNIYIYMYICSRAALAVGSEPTSSQPDSAAIRLDNIDNCRDFTTFVSLIQTISHLQIPMSNSSASNVSNSDKNGPAFASIPSYSSDASSNIMAYLFSESLYNHLKAKPEEGEPSLLLFASDKANPKEVACLSFTLGGVTTPQITFNFPRRLEQPFLPLVTLRYMNKCGIDWGADDVPVPWIREFLDKERPQ